MHHPEEGGKHSNWNGLLLTWWPTLHEVVHQIQGLAGKWEHPIVLADADKQQDCANLQNSNSVNIN